MCGRERYRFTGTGERKICLGLTTFVCVCVCVLNCRWDFYFMGTKLLLCCFINFVHSHALCLRNYLVE